MVTLAGICLIIGAYFTYKGEIFYAVMCYLVADIVWIYLAVLVGDVQGAIFVTIGALLGVGAFLKMRFGKLKRDIKIEEIS